MSRKRGHESRDLPPAVVMGAIGGLWGLILLGVLVAWGLAAWFRANEPKVQTSAFDRAAAAPAAPALAVDERADRIVLEGKAEARITGYGRSDAGPGLARIPIDRAMTLLAAKGWPDADAPASSETGSAR